MDCLDLPVSKLIPEALTTALVLISLAISWAPYLAGQDIGPLKVPNVPPRFARILRIGGPLLVIALIVVLFVPLKFILRQDCGPLKNRSAEIVTGDGVSPLYWTPNISLGRKASSRLQMIRRIADRKALRHPAMFQITLLGPNQCA
jgi:hypothetical protein